MADLALWLWTLLMRGESGRAYNVGSDEGMSIAEAAQLTAATLRPDLPIQIDGTPDPSWLSAASCIAAGCVIDCTSLP